MQRQDWINKALTDDNPDKKTIVAYVAETKILVGSVSLKEQNMEGLFPSV